MGYRTIYEARLKEQEQEKKVQEVLENADDFELKRERYNMENKTEFEINDSTLILNIELKNGDDLKIELVDEKTVLYGTYIGLNDDYELIFILCNGIEMEIDPDFIKRITLNI